LLALLQDGPYKKGGNILTPHVKDLAQDLAQDVAQDLAQDVAQGAAFGGPSGARPPRYATTAAAAVFVQLVTR